MRGSVFFNFNIDVLYLVEAEVPVDVSPAVDGI